MPQTQNGTGLHPDDRRHVLAAFTHRHTGDHKPTWARNPMPNGQAYPVQFKDDADWLYNTEFYVRRDGRLDRRFDHCMSRPTWPNNPELRKEGMAA